MFFSDLYLLNKKAGHAYNYQGKWGLGVMPWNRQVKQWQG